MLQYKSWKVKVKVVVFVFEDGSFVFWHLKLKVGFLRREMLTRWMVCLLAFVVKGGFFSHGGLIISYITQASRGIPIFASDVLDFLLYS